MQDKQMLQAVSRPNTAVEVDRLLDHGSWGKYQTAILSMSGLIIILDGIDIQLFGVVIPALMNDWKLPAAAFAPVVAAGLFGMLLGGLIMGAIGDRFGRRFALICSACIFGIASIALSTATTLAGLAVLRFIGSFGLQGATPNSAALVSECVPRRHRALAVTLVVVCIPLGASLAGLIAIPLLPAVGWRWLFFLGGTLPILLSLGLIRLLPESPQYLARHPNRWPELSIVVERLGHPPVTNPVFVSSVETRNSDPFAKAVLGADVRLDTLALWSSFFFCLLAVYASTNWIPAVLTGSGLSFTVANTAIAVFNLGGVLGALGAALSIGRFGSRRTMLIMTAGATVGALILALMRINQHTAITAMISFLGITGGLINAVQAAMYTLAASMYKTSVRATGIGAASSVGRLGAILSPYAGNWSFALGGNSAFFALLSVSMFCAHISLALIRRHIPSSTDRTFSTAK
jgi:AAHS family 4-hydroxybenzoate transporter-like MFS transporter